jgi:hypothetical protein
MIFEILILHLLTIVKYYNKLKLKKHEKIKLFFIYNCPFLSRV